MSNGKQVAMILLVILISLLIILYQIYVLFHHLSELIPNIRLL